MCRSAVNDGSCSPWVMCSCSVVRGNQIRDKRVGCLLWSCSHLMVETHQNEICLLVL